ncbi:hypothetical protein TNCT_125121 [Trichonephila clavata]|uniref:Uncharacterized protein n=1 Tax=Trichonephila clavata TaxID=2740835 RepID=A0A8X6L7G5_TRICU|nr:hypothetical protein TNCT_125121 [Trichonephila clavata]
MGHITSLEKVNKFVALNKVLRELRKTETYDVFTSMSPLIEDRKRVACNRGGLTEIPTLHMDVDIQVLIITAPPNHYNELTIGRIFLDFHELEENLKILDLSYNGIATSPSAPFRLLPNLRTLSLARNKLRTLVPRFFYMLAKLEKLDLSGNPLRDIDPENLKDVSSEKISFGKMSVT